MEPGVYYDLPAEEYHQLDAISSTLLRGMECPEAWREGEEETDAMRFGTRQHMHLLQPDTFRQLYATFDEAKPKWGGKGSQERLDAWKARRDEHEATATRQGRQVVSAEELDTMERMAAKIRSRGDRVSRFLKAGGPTEVTAIWEHTSGELCKARADLLAPLRGGKFLIVDCKNTNNAHPEAFRHAALFRYAYHVQAAHYFQGFSEVMPGQIAGFAFIAYERTPPYKASFMFADPTFLVAGRRQAAVYFSTYLRCRGADVWPCYPDHYELRAGEKHRVWEPAGYSPGDDEEPF